MYLLRKFGIVAIVTRSYRTANKCFSHKRICLNVKALQIQSNLPHTVTAISPGETEIT